ARQKGIWIAGGGEVWTLHRTAERIRLSDCECMERVWDAGGKPGEACLRTDDALRWSLRAVGSGREIPFREVPAWGNSGSGDEMPLGAWGVAGTVHATLGDTVVASVCVYSSACGGAHGATTCVDSVIDLAT